jgi:hypothetical protein
MNSIHKKAKSMLYGHSKRIRGLQDGLKYRYSLLQGSSSLFLFLIIMSSIGTNAIDVKATTTETTTTEHQYLTCCIT